jgi:flagellum-specific peptidoglycan hydrolase FlgJ
MKQLKKQISEKEETTSIPHTNLLTFNEFSLIKKLIRGLLALAFLAIVSLFTTALLEIPSKAMNTNSNNNLSIENSNSVYISKVRNYSEEKLITEVDTYMKSVVPEEKLNAKLLVQLCGKYKIDLSLVIAQGILESHLGTRGLAVQTNSVWNVGSFDNGKIHYSYSNPNEAIEPYLKLIRERYLIRITSAGDTLQKEVRSLIADRGYVNCEGHRYATSLSYENTLRYWILRVQMDSKIKLYQDIKTLPDQDILGFFVPQEEPKDSLLMAKL